MQAIKLSKDNIEKQMISKQDRHIPMFVRNLKLRTIIDDFEVLRRQGPRDLVAARAVQHSSEAVPVIGRIRRRRNTT